MAGAKRTGNGAGARSNGAAAAGSSGTGAGARAAGRGGLSGAERSANHDAIARLADELLPSLIAKLGASGLGEIEVREGEWHVRLRGGRPGAGGRQKTSGTDRSARSQPGHAGHGHAPGALEPKRDVRRDGSRPAAPERDDETNRSVATSPAVGVFQPRSGITAGTKVRAGDRVAYVELLGIPQEVLSPVDGIVGASLVEPGEAVEYGQELIRIELASGPRQPAAVPVDAGLSVTDPGHATAGGGS